MARWRPRSRAPRRHARRRCRAVCRRHYGALARPAAGPRPGDRGQFAALSESEPKPPWPAGKWWPIPALSSLRRATGSRLPVTRRAGSAPARPRARRAPRRPRGDDAERSGGHSCSYAARGAGDLVGPRVDRGVGDARRGAASRALSPHRSGPRPRPARRRARRRGPPGGAPQRRRVLVRGTQQQRAVDVPEQEEERSAEERMSELSFCANAAISFAVFSTSSSWTISTGECM